MNTTPKTAMKSLAASGALALAVSIAAAPPATAQVKQVEMDIAGYLCGF